VEIALKTLGISLAVGFDVLALSIVVGVMDIPIGARIRMGAAFSFAEVLMQVIGYAIGTGAGRIASSIAPYVGFAVLAGIGVLVIRESFEESPTLKVDSGWGLIAASISISLDSLGIGVSLPGVPIPLLPLLCTVAVTTVLFTIAGLAFGRSLGQKNRSRAQLAGGIILIVLAGVFAVQRALGGTG
jgi:putative Mn2+ efflux pump MntP